MVVFKSGSVFSLIWIRVFFFLLGGVDWIAEVWVELGSF